MTKANAIVEEMVTAMGGMKIMMLPFYPMGFCKQKTVVE
jgi:hypothetical protein